MGHLYRILGLAAMLGLVSVGSLAEGRSPASLTGDSDPDAPSTKETAGQIQGVVTNDEGAPLDGAMISAVGASGMAVAVCDRTGRYELPSLPPGPYLVRAHLSGYAASGQDVVEVKANLPAVRAFTLRRNSGVAPAPTADLPAPAIVEAGLAPAASQPDPLDQIEPIEDTAAPPPHDHGETAWRLRRARRSILKETAVGIATVAAAEPPTDSPFPPKTLPLVGRPLESSVRFAGALFDELPISGQLNLVTSRSFDEPTDLLSSNGPPGGITYVAIGAPAGRHADLFVRGAMTNGDISSWVLAGSYVARAPATHALDVGMSYSTQRYEGGNPAALAAASAESRNVGALHVFDDWAVSERIRLNYGARYAHHDYLAAPALFSPRMGVTFSPQERTRLRALISQRMLAPGAEEFLPPTTGIWLPPERTFAPVSGEQLRSERTRHVEVALERELAGAYVVGVRRFYQAVSDQLVTLFGLRLADGVRSDLGHYYVASAGSVDTGGWGVTLRRTLPGRVRGSVDYSVTKARWRPSLDTGLLQPLAPSAMRPEAEEFHEVTTSVETDIPETATRVFVVYRMNTAFTRPDVDAAEPGLDGRFDVQIKQALPFSPFDGSDWEVLVAVRSLFRDVWDDASAYDELLVVRPPKRILGGLVVRF